MDEELDLGRYESMAGYEPPDLYKKQRAKAKKESEHTDRITAPILCKSNGREAAEAEQRFSSLWRSGEVALLYGEPGVGKSIFAVRLAEAIATGDWSAGVSPALRQPALQKPARSKGISACRVVYIDLQRTAIQFHQRFPGAAVDHRHFDWSTHCSDETDTDRAKRVHSSIHEAIEDGAEAVILDDITLGGINIGRPLGPLRTLRTLKMFAAENGTSFLVIAGARAHKRPHAASLADVAHRHIADQADSVFCLAASTYGPAFRYIRHLRSNTGPIVHDESNVLTYALVDSGQLKVDSENQGSPPCLGGVANGRGGSSDNFPASSLIPHSEIRTPQSESSSLVTHHSSLSYLGTCPEELHLIDYAAEALRTEREKERERKRALNRSNKDFLIDGLMNGSYTRYLKGE